MKLHEYQAKQIFARHGVPIPIGKVVFDADRIEASTKELLDETGGKVVVVKAQIHAGGRGKGGGVKVVKGGVQEVGKVAREILGMQLVTKQTGPAGQKVRRIYLEQGLDIARELYLAVLVDRETRRVAIISSTEGGMDIEEVAAKQPDKISTTFIDPLLGLAAFQARQIAFKLGLREKKTMRAFAKLLSSLYECFIKEDATLAEVNPLVVTSDGEVVALDAKMSVDDNSSFRHREWPELRDIEEEDAVEVEAKRAGLSYVSLDGNIGCLVNGAGLAMSTMDIIKHYGGEPANFLDVGGSASEEQVTTAFAMILKSDKVQGIFVNIFGGIMQCDIIAEGVVAATKKLGLKVPLVVRLEGNKVNKGKKILDESGLTIQSASSMADGAQKIVAAVSK